MDGCSKRLMNGLIKKEFVSESIDEMEKQKKYIGGD